MRGRVFSSVSEGGGAEDFLANTTGGLLTAVNQTSLGFLEDRSSLVTSSCTNLPMKLKIQNFRRFLQVEFR